MQANIDYDASYDGAFYSSRRGMTLASARRIFRLVQDVVPISLMADSGCGSGTWLTVAIDELGVSSAYGLEGPWMTKAALDNSAIAFHSQNLKQSVGLPQSVDLAISLEVAKHLSDKRAASFVEDLCAASPCALFGAAIQVQRAWTTLMSNGRVIGQICSMPADTRLLIWSALRSGASPKSHTGISKTSSFTFEEKRRHN